jgi:hypothetical protein
MRYVAKNPADRSFHLADEPHVRSYCKRLRGNLAVIDSDAASEHIADRTATVCPGCRTVLDERRAAQRAMNDDAFMITASEPRPRTRPAAAEPTLFDALDGDEPFPVDEPLPVVDVAAVVAAGVPVVDPAPAGQAVADAAADGGPTGEEVPDGRPGEADLSGAEQEGEGSADAGGQPDDVDYEAIAAGLKLIRKANRAVEARRVVTDKPGADWHVRETVEGYTGTPVYHGLHATASLYATDDGTAYQVAVFSRTGKLLHEATRKSLDAAFRLGQKLANAEPQGEPKTGAVAPETGGKRRAVMARAAKDAASTPVRPADGEGWENGRIAERAAVLKGWATTADAEAYAARYPQCVQLGERNTRYAGEHRRSPLLSTVVAAGVEFPARWELGDRGGLTVTMPGGRDVHGTWAQVSREVRAWLLAHRPEHVVASGETYEKAESATAHRETEKTAAAPHDLGADEGREAEGAAPTADVTAGTGTHSRGEQPTDPVAVFIASAHSTPARARVLWWMRRADAVRVCTDPRTAWTSSALHWTATLDPAAQGADWEFVADRRPAETAALFAELGVTPLPRETIGAADPAQEPGAVGRAAGEDLAADDAACDETIRYVVPVPATALRGHSLEGICTCGAPPWSFIPKQPQTHPGETGCGRSRPG